MWFEECLNWFLKLHLDILELWLFCGISVISEFLFLGIGLKSKTRVPQKIFIFELFLFKLYQIHFRVCLCLFILAEFVIPLLNCFFRDFRGFRVFDLALLNSFRININTLFLLFLFCWIPTRICLNSFLLRIT